MNLKKKSQVLQNLIVHLYPSSKKQDYQNLLLTPQQKASKFLQYLTKGKNKQNDKTAA